MEEFQVELIAVDKIDQNKDVSLTKVVHAASEFEAIEKAKELAKSENPDFNHPQIWAWNIQRRFLR